MQKKVRLLIIDDHPLVREGLKTVLEKEADIEIIDEAGDGQGAINLARSLQPDLILMDINMPGTDGVEAAKVIKREFPHIKIIILTGYKEEEHVLELIRIGVSGYLLKDIIPSKLVETIRVVAAGDSVIDPGITRLLFTELNRMTRRHQAREEWKILTEREMDVLKLMTQGQSNKEIAMQLLISEKTVKNHITSIFRKLQVADRTQAVLFAIKNDLVKVK